MLRSTTVRWVMWLFLAWLLFTSCVMLYPHAVAASSGTGPLVVGAAIGSVGFVVSGIVVFARLVTWPLRRQRSHSA